MSTAPRVRDINGWGSGITSSLEPGVVCFDGKTLAVRTNSNGHLVTVPLSGEDAFYLDRSLDVAGAVATLKPSLRLRAVPLGMGFNKRSRPARIHGALLVFDEDVGVAFGCSFSTASRDVEFGAGALTLDGKAAPHRDSYALGFAAWRLEWVNQHGEVVLELERSAEE
jgi:hypothetical protein